MHLEILAKARDPAQTFMTQNYRHFVQCLAIDHFHRALRAAGREYRRDDAGRPLGRPRHVPHALISSLESEDGRERALDDLRLTEESGVGATTLDRDEARRILSYVDDQIDRYVFFLRAVAGLTWHDIVERLAQSGRPYVERTVRERFDATRTYLRACIEIENERVDRALMVTPAFVRAEAARRGYRQKGRAQQPVAAGSTAAPLATRLAEPDFAAERAPGHSASPNAMTTSGTPPQRASGAHGHDQAIHGRVEQEDTDMRNGGVNDLANDRHWAAATPVAMANEAADASAAHAQPHALSDDQVARSADEASGPAAGPAAGPASGDDPAPDTDDLAVAVMERLLESVTARLPLHGEPWTPAEREAYLAAFDQFAEWAHLYADFWPVK
jgi:hypothetical protein